ncbi:MAG: hypothetical protein MUF81_20975, partial [Verrucomicrobia bacterium]|nr:hypothetical protein [Verrucomicrobiota bacterium]
IGVETNVWVTDRTFHGLGKRPVKENILHLLDDDSTGIYTLTYEALPAPDTTPPTSVVALLPADSRENIPVHWSGQDPGGAIAYYDLYVSQNSGAFTRWLAAAAGTTAVYPGTFGSTYAFYSIAIDQAGNREAAPLTPDTQTIVSLTNQAPILAALTNRTWRH